MKESIKPSFTPFFESPPDFSMKIGGTVYDVTTHWNTEGSQTVLQQFKELLLSKQIDLDAPSHIGNRRLSIVK